MHAESHMYLLDTKSSPSLTGKNNIRRVSSIRLNLLTKTNWKLKTQGGILVFRVLVQVCLPSAYLPPVAYPCPRHFSSLLPTSDPAYFSPCAYTCPRLNLPYHPISCLFPPSSYRYPCLFAPCLFPTCCIPLPPAIFLH